MVVGTAEPPSIHLIYCVGSDITRLKIVLIGVI